MLTKATAENAHALNIRISALCRRIKNDNNKIFVELFERSSISFTMNIYKVCRIVKITDVLPYAINALEDLCEIEYFVKYFRDQRLIPEDQAMFILEPAAIIRKTLSRAIKLAMIK